MNFTITLGKFQMDLIDTFHIQILNIGTSRGNSSLFEVGWFYGEFIFDILYIYGIIGLIQELIDKRRYG